VLHKNKLLHTLAESSLATLQQELRPRRDRIDATSRRLPGLFHSKQNVSQFKKPSAAE
jgi:hypothetical protein